MRVLTVVLLVLFLFSGCASNERLETVSDVYDIPVSSPVQEIMLVLPEGAAEAVLSTGDGCSFYVCDGYSVAASTFAGGNLSDTIRKVTGFEKEALTIVTTQENGYSQHSCAWTTMGEVTEQICKAVILDDGNSYYAVTVMCDYEVAGELNQKINNVLNSVTLRNG